MAAEPIDIPEPEYRFLQLRDIWRHETDFTAWLCKNLNRLERSTGLKMEKACHQVTTERGRCDIVAKEVGTDNCIIIEVKYDMLDNKHVGQGLSYKTSHNATHVIWIAEFIPPALKAVIDDQNRGYAGNVKHYALQTEINQFKNEKPTLEFEAVCVPTSVEERLETAAAVEDARDHVLGTGSKKARSQSERDYKAYWDDFSSWLCEQPPLPFSFQASWHHYIHATLGMDKVNLEVLIGIKKISVGLEIKERKSWKEFYAFLLARRAQIEEEIGDVVVWDPKPRRVGIRVEYHIDFRNLAERRHQFEWLRAKSMKLHPIFKRLVAEFKASQKQKVA